MPRELGNRTPRRARREKELWRDREKDLRRNPFEYIRRLACGVCWCTRPHTWRFGTPSLPHEVQRFVRLTGRRWLLGLRRRPLFPSLPSTLSTPTQATRIDFPRAPIISFPRVRLTR